MKKDSPPNVVCLAAELMASASPHWKAHPYRAACVATDLCAMGRRYKRLSERLCGGEEEWGEYPAAGDRMAKAERQREALRSKMVKLLAESPFKGHIDGDSLILSVVTRRGPSAIEERTALL